MADFINADVKIDKFNEIIDIAKRTASDLSLIGALYEPR